MVVNIVTGATGFLGGALARELHRRGETVIGIGRNKKKGAELVAQGISFLPLDITHEKVIAHLLPRADYLFHCAAKSEESGLKEEFYKTNVSATRNLFVVAYQKSFKKVIYVSTPSVYTSTKHQLNFTEDSPKTTSPLNEYIKSKIIAEDLVKESVLAGLDIVMVRPRGIIGPGDTTIIPKILQQKTLPFIDGGSALIDLTHIDDAVNALILARDNGVTGKAYNISSGQPQSFSSLAKTLYATLNRPLRSRSFPFALAYVGAAAAEFLGFSSLTRYGVCLIGRSQTFDLSLANKDLKYIPQKNIYEGIKEWAKNV